MQTRFQKMRARLSSFVKVSLCRWSMHVWCRKSICRMPISMLKSMPCKLSARERRRSWWLWGAPANSILTFTHRIGSGGTSNRSRWTKMRLTRRTNANSRLQSTSDPYFEAACYCFDEYQYAHNLASWLPPYFRNLLFLSLLACKTHDSITIPQSHTRRMWDFWLLHSLT